MMVGAQRGGVRSFPPFFGERRELQHPPLQRIEFTAGDGSPLLLHNTSGGNRGPVIITPGTAMTALTYCIDTVPCNLVEFLVGQGFDVWLFDWRTSPLLGAHQRAYTMDDVAHYDWPAAIDKVRSLTGRNQVTVLAHCLSSPCFLLSLVRGYQPREQVRAFVASQVALHLNMTTMGTLKLKTRMDRLLPGGDMIHQKPSEVTAHIADLAVSALSWVLPTSYSCDQRTCHRHSATFGDVIYHPRLNAPTHAMMGDLIPECLAAFLKDVAVWSRKTTVLLDEDLRHLDRLQLPIQFISGSENHMFVPKGTERTFQMLCDANGPSNYRRNVYQGFGHLDCFVGDGASDAIWPDLAKTLA